MATLESVRALYIAIRRLHRTLPSVQRALGDRVVHDEWRAMSTALRGNKATPAQQTEFVRQWNAYAQTLLDTTLVRGRVGWVHSSPASADALSPVDHQGTSDVVVDEQALEQQLSPDQRKQLLRLRLEVDKLRE